MVVEGPTGDGVMRHLATNYSKCCVVEEKCQRLKAWDFFMLWSEGRHSRELDLESERTRDKDSEGQCRRGGTKPRQYCQPLDTNMSAVRAQLPTDVGLQNTESMQVGQQRFGLAHLTAKS